MISVTPCPPQGLPRFMSYGQPLGSPDLRSRTEELGMLCRISLSSSVSSAVVESSDSWSLCPTCVNSWGVVESLAPIASFVVSGRGDVALRTASYGGSLVCGIAAWNHFERVQRHGCFPVNTTLIFVAKVSCLIKSFVRVKTSIFQRQTQPLLIGYFLLLTYLAFQCVLLIVQDLSQPWHLLRCSLCRERLTMSQYRLYTCIFQKRILTFLSFSFTYVSYVYVRNVRYVWFVWYGMV